MNFRKILAPRHAIAALMTVAAAASLAGGCSRQSEGERCSLTNGDEDCDGSLVCTQAEELQLDDGVDRCCPPQGDAFSDSRCTPRIGGGSSGGSTGAGGGTGQGGENVGGAAGEGNGRDEPCSYNSDCTSGLICGPGGQCQPECNEDIDCPADRPVCNSAQECIAAAAN